MEHDPHIRRAIALAQQGMDGGHGGPFGAVVVRHGEVIGEGHNCVLSQTNSTLHGEVTAMTEAERSIRSPWLTDCDLYTSCEPCPMCLTAALWARVSRIFYAANRHDAAEIGFDDAAFYEELRMDPQGKLLKVFALSEEYRQQARAVMLRWPATQQTY